jgi:hypothetical protein
LPEVWFELQTVNEWLQAFSSSDDDYEVEYSCSSSDDNEEPRIIKDMRRLIAVRVDRETEEISAQMSFDERATSDVTLCQK